MTTYVDHHSLAILSCATAALDLLSTQPETDVMCEIYGLLELQIEVINCTINSRHYGSDALDEIIQKSTAIMGQVEELEGGE